MGSDIHRSFALSALLLCGATAAQYVDTTGTVHRRFHRQIAMYSVLMVPRNPIWMGDSLTCEARSFGAPVLGGEFMLRRRDSWLLGISVASTRVYTDAIHWRSSVFSSNTEWTVHGERLGLDQCFTTFGVVTAFEPWHYPRRHKVGMTLQLGAGLHYMHFSETRYAIPDGEAEGKHYSGGNFYSYPSHDGMQELGRSRDDGICAQLWLRPEVHLGRRVSLLWDLGLVFSTYFQADGSSYTSPQGSTFNIVPHRVDMARPLVRGGIAVYF